VAIVKSRDLEPYAAAVSAFSVGARARLMEYDLADDDARARQAFADVKARGAALVWALGPAAATAARRLVPGVPLLFALVPNHDKYDLGGSGVTGIALTRPARAQLETLKAVAPTAKRVGVLFDPRWSGPFFENAQRAAGQLGLLLVPARVSDPGEVAAVVPQLGGKVDALWMIADRTASTVGAFEALLSFSRARSVPLFALSEEQVRAGALVSLSPDAAAIGRQAARTANRILHEGVAPEALPVVEPEGLDLAINVTTARGMTTGCNLALDIFTYAARRGYPIKVFE